MPQESDNEISIDHFTISGDVLSQEDTLRDSPVKKDGSSKQQASDTQDEFNNLLRESVDDSLNNDS